MKSGSLNGPAHDLRVAVWIDDAGAPIEKPLRLADMGDGYKIIYCFQHWCPGCHSRGFPTLKYLHDNLRDKGFSFRRSKQFLKAPRSIQSTNSASIRNNTV